MKLGAHQSTAGGYINALEKITKIGGNCLQIFSASPRGWHFPKLTDEIISEWQSAQEKYMIEPVYFHASYLINLAFDNRLGQVSKNHLIHELHNASKLGIKGSIIHLGSFKWDNPNTPIDERKLSYEILIKNIKDIVTKMTGDTLFIIENAATNKIGRKLEEIAQIIKEVNDPRIKVCLDTCHLFCAGYEINTQNGLDNFITQFEELIGMDKLEVIHINDSKDPFASGRDRHENIGEGTLRLETFKLILDHPKLRHLPFILETPGFDDKGPDKKNLDILKNLLKN